MLWAILSIFLTLVLGVGCKDNNEWNFIVYLEIDKKIMINMLI